MHRWLVALALVGCGSPAVRDPPPPSWVYAPPPPLWGTGADRGRFGRGQAPQPVVSLGIVGPAGLAPLRGAAAWALPGDGPARAVISGTDATGARFSDVVDIDAGRVEHRVTCPAQPASPDPACAGGERRAGGTDGDLIAARGDRRLVRASADSAMLVDAKGVRALLAFGEGDAVLGDTAILVASEGGVRRFAIPPAWGHHLRAWRDAGVAVPAELRDLPAHTMLQPGVDAPGGIQLGIGQVAIDPEDPAALYSAVGGFRDVAVPTMGIARADLRTRTWGWIRPDVCPMGSFVITHDAIICGGPALVRALGKDGAPRWDWPGRALGVLAAGELVLARDDTRATLLDATDGHVLAALASDDGGPVRAAPLSIEGAAWLVAVERGRLVARLPRAAMLAVWSRAIDGTVRALTAAGDGVLVELDGGDAYRVDARTGEVAALPGLGQHWTAFADTLVGGTAGGPIPPRDLRWLPPPPTPVLLPHGAPPAHVEVDSPPPFATTVWPPPPPMAASVQLTLFDPGGGVRARNDYALGPFAMRASAARGPAGSPIVVTDGMVLLVLDPATGDAVSRVRFPSTIDGVTHSPAGESFSSVVDGAPVAGAVYGDPLRLVVF